MSAPDDPRRCQGLPPICDRCGVALAVDPAGAWCRSCRRTWPEDGRFPACRATAIAAGNTTRTRGLRLCRNHARRLVDAGGPDAIVPDRRPTG
ncbi:hypothetical protein [Catenulispora subtropica]|uniref:hypothetical protein n=1 Tax=Catenulispora subtropica TaxID=450798 RepID=UPI0031D3C37E